MKVRRVATSILFCLVLAATSAQAGLIVDTTSTNLTAYGFGTVPTILTLQRDVLERGCVSPTNNSGGLSTLCTAFGSGYGDLAGSLSNPLGSPKYATPTLAELGVTNWESLGILFNVNEPNNLEAVTLQKLTLNLYDGTALAYTFDLSDGSGIQDFTVISQGQGSAGFVIRIAEDQWPTDFSSALRVGLAAEVGCTTEPCEALGQFGTGDGPESFTVANIGGGGPGQEIPEPATAALLGGGLLVFAWALRRRKAS